jgi:hypothetical protein
MYQKVGGVIKRVVKERGSCVWTVQRAVEGADYF